MKRLPSTNLIDILLELCDSAGAVADKNAALLQAAARVETFTGTTTSGIGSGTNTPGAARAGPFTVPTTSGSGSGSCTPGSDPASTFTVPATSGSGSGTRTPGSPVGGQN